MYKQILNQFTQEMKSYPYVRKYIEYSWNKKVLKAEAWIREVMVIEKRKGSFDSSDKNRHKNNNLVCKAWKIFTGGGAWKHVPFWQKSWLKEKE